MKNSDHSWPRYYFSTTKIGYIPYPSELLNNIFEVKEIKNKNDIMYKIINNIPSLNGLFIMSEHCEIVNDLPKELFTL